MSATISGTFLQQGLFKCGKYFLLALSRVKTGRGRTEREKCSLLVVEKAMMRHLPVLFFSVHPEKDLHIFLQRANTTKQ